jgi:hypothetical protein
MAGITYDTGVLIAAERGDRRVWALHRRSLERGMMPTVPAGSWRRAGGEAPSTRCPDCSTSPNLLKIYHQAGKLRSRL